MTEAKSPREIADEIAGGTPVGRSYCQRCQSYDHECGCTPDMDAVIRADLAERVLQALLSYAAERERLLVSAQENLARVQNHLSHVAGELAEADAVVARHCDWMASETDWGRCGAVWADDTQRATARHQSRLSSRPATEGKGE